MKKTLFLLFGITGDLAQRKILPALYQLQNSSQYSFDVWGVGRRNFENNDLYDYLSQNPNCLKDKDGYDDFIKTIDYFKLELLDLSHYQNMFEHLKSIRNDFDDIILYFSISPDFFERALINIKKSGIQKYIDKVAFEKPFGHNLQSAEILNDSVLAVFEEKQIYRIDHYLGKESVQNILNFRFSNIFFEKIWNNEYIENIQIIASEKVSVLDRGEYYDNYGALRDMFQNHVLQILAQVTISKPQDLNFGNIKNQKAQIIKNLRLFDDDDSNIIFGQYNGYLEEKGVKEKSNTDTFVSAKLEINTPAMKGIPIYIKTGKSLDDKITKVIVNFKTLPYFDDAQTLSNQIIFDICNKESIEINLNVKNVLENKSLKICSPKFNEHESKIDAYYRLLGDIMLGESLWFPRWDMIASSWKFVDSLVCMKDSGAEIHTYDIGTKGPKASDELLKKDGTQRFE